MRRQREGETPASPAEREPKDGSGSGDLVARGLAEAERRIGARGGRLTRWRREVLRVILEASGPIGAYGVLEALRGEHPALTPPTVYRALDFLMAHGLVHRISHLAAFVPCHRGEEEAHRAQFLICRGCGRTIELDLPDLAALLERRAASEGFAIEAMTVEAEGLCAECRLSAGRDG